MKDDAHADDLWTCPECGAKLLTKNLWHSCGEATLDARRLNEKEER